MNAHQIYARISPWFRRRRLRRFAEAFRPTPTTRILDVGGTVAFWAAAPLPARITLLNAMPPELPPATAAPAGVVAALGGDGCDLPFAAESFDIAFSNSVIEHVGDWGRQQDFAREIRRVGRGLWVQTPARAFPIEPHLLALGVHWLPRRWQRRILRWVAPRAWLERWTQADVDAFLAEVRLLNAAEMRQLFPDCVIVRETFLGLTKSYIAHRPSPACP